MFSSVSSAISACVLDYVDIRSPPIINIMAGSICNFSSFPPDFFCAARYQLECHAPISQFCLIKLAACLLFSVVDDMPCSQVGSGVPFQCNIQSVGFRCVPATILRLGKVLAV